VVRHRSYGPAALTQQRHDLAAHAADSPAGTGHQDETRLSHRPLPFVIPAIQSTAADRVISPATGVLGRM
jgi:hypothetical protein